MVVRKFPSFKQTSKKIKTASLVIASAALLSTAVSCGGEEYEEKVVLSPTQGVITSVLEVEKDQFKITDEQTVATPDDSRIIAEYMDGQRDTFTLEEAQLVGSGDGANASRSSGMRGVLMGGLMGYMMGKSMRTPPSRSAYANDKAFNKSSTTNSSMKSSASRKTVRTPKSGFGSSKSSRSYGG